MKHVVVFALISLVSAGLIACNDGTPPPKRQTGFAAAQPADLGQAHTFMDPQIKALNKAKNVQKIVNDQQQLQNKQLEEQGG